MKKRINYICLIVLLLLPKLMWAQQLRTEVFDLLDLNRPGLEEVKKLHNKGQDEKAAEALLKYYKNRTSVKHPDVNLAKVKISKEEQKWADDALNHTFFVHKGYQPSLNYGKDINWQYWPVKDNELRWQLHRHKWFTPMGKAYRLSGDEKYAKEWALQYMDWIKKNPLIPLKKNEYEMQTKPFSDSIKENVRFAWRPLEVSNRLQDQTAQFLYFISSPSFTPDFLTEFLMNYHKHAVHIMGNYSDQGNHLLFEAQRMIYAGTFFPEFKEAETWRRSGIDILNKEINVQVYKDGGQFELDPHYHLAAINIFYKAIQIADVNNFRNEFPQSYLDTVEKMIMIYINYCFPDYTNPCFSDAKITDKKEIIDNLKTWSKVFPQNKQIQYFATEGKKGELPDYLSNAFKTSGFYVFRSSWGDDATMMVLKAGPKAFWHCQPDNGTFELWMNGKNLFPDSGSYVYEGEGEVSQLRKWFRQTKVHNTLTLNNANLDSTESVCKLWNGKGNIQKLVVENPSYKGLKHRRSVFFVDNKFFVIVDEAVGNAKGNVAIHYGLCEGKTNLDKENMTVASDFDGNSNVVLKCFGPKGMTMNKEEGWRSKTYRERAERTSVAFETQKNTDEAVRYITVIYPVTDKNEQPAISAQFNNKSYSDNSLDITVKVGVEKNKLGVENKKEGVENKKLGVKNYKLSYKY
ncbi:heparin-sulfate lyase HepC [Bacteroides sedimenti]|uniref:Heparinase n=1 Tax=Bacteroides sedimenti TaxID=2136147 RepID=A0ABM8IDV9_9BACE